MAEGQLKGQMASVMEEVRRRAFAEGYAAAVKDMQELAFGTAAPASINTADEAVSKKQNTENIISRSHETETSTSRRLKEDYKPRASKGETAQLVLEVMQVIAPKAVGPTEILHLIREIKGTIVPFTSLRRGIAKLEEDGKIIKKENVQSWMVAQK